MKFTSVIAAALITVGVSAQNSPIISVTAPLQGASYKAGDKAIISWVNPSVDSISQIVLAKGSSNALQPVTTIATNVPAASGSYTWNIPADTPAGSDYAFEFGTSPQLAFTGQFSITGGTPGAGSGSSNSSSGSSGSSGSSSSSSSSGGSSSSPSDSKSSGSPASSGSASDASSSTTSAANSLTVGSIVAVGVVAAIAQLF
ncbi:hypothetical protein [Absidia glauca]|uniref:Yeast cell wall synthesis Kre9/Knh1-like N-terminal domain-containing protein n=1 Tax=Absidia glauca TaxID=4829 RepID=A0A163J0Q1_ABSGL|nr:hypothetical protein [Absidia glauca]